MHKAPFSGSMAHNYYHYYFFFQQNAIHEIEQINSAVNVDENQNGDADSSENSTDPSGEFSDEHGHVLHVPGSWQRFAHTKFQTKASYSYCCAPLQQPLLPKRDKADHLVFPILRFQPFIFSLQP